MPLMMMMESTWDRWTFTRIFAGSGNDILKMSDDSGSWVHFLSLLHAKQSRKHLHQLSQQNGNHVNFVTYSVLFFPTKTSAMTGPGLESTTGEDEVPVPTVPRLDMNSQPASHWEFKEIVSKLHMEKKAFATPHWTTWPHQILGSDIFSVVRSSSDAL